MMRIVCSSNMPYANEAFSPLGDVRVLDGRSITAADVRDADILAIRSTTRVDRALLDGSRVRFVGTATIGTDHMDTAYLDENGIAWCYSPGCNANSVSEYFTAALLWLAEQKGMCLAGRTLGVVGVGNVGRRIVEKAQALGMRVRPNDPPRQRVEGDQPDEAAPPFVSLDDLLRSADVVSLHVPLATSGPDRTFHLADASLFERARPGLVFINAARGGVMATAALCDALESGRVGHAVIDTWEGEPAYDHVLLDRAALGTPHIAGHSFEGKVMGTLMVYEAACRFLGREPAWRPEPLLPPAPVPELDVDAGGRSDEAVLGEIVRAVYDIEDDDRRLRAGRNADEQQRSAHFDGLRRNYPVRREFRFTKVRLSNAAPGLRHKVRSLGFPLL